MRWPWAWSTIGPRRLPVSLRIRRSGTWGREDTWEGSIPFSFPVRCTAWRRTCIRFSFLRRAPVRPDRALAAVGSAAGADSQAEDLAAAAAVRFEPAPFLTVNTALRI